MRRIVVWTDRARDEFHVILRRIAEENSDAAERVADRIDEAAATLSEHATGRVGRVSSTYEKVLTGLPYILAYSFAPMAEGGELVAILHVIHTARDWPAGEWPRG